MLEVNAKAFKNATLHISQEKEFLFCVPREMFCIKKVMESQQRSCPADMGENNIGVFCGWNMLI